MRAPALISLLMLSLLAAPASAQDEDDGGGFLERQLEGALSSAGRDVTIRGFAGALSSEASFDSLTMADADGVWLRISDVTLDWTRSALLRGRVEVNTLAAGEIEVLRQPLPAPGVSPEMAEAQPFALPELPVSINIGTIEAETIRLGAPLLGEELELTLSGGMSLGGGEGQATLDLSRLDGRGRIALDAGFDNESRVLRLDLSVDEAAGGIAARLLDLPGQPAVALTVQGEAPLSDYAADLRLATDGTDRLTGRVTLAEAEDGTRFEARLDGDLTPLMPEEYRPFFGSQTALDLRGTSAADGALAIDRLSLAAAQLSLDGTLALDPAGWPRRFDLSGQVGNGDAPVRLPVAGPPVTLGAARITAAYDVASGDRWRAQVTIDDLEQPDLTVGEATVDARGRLGRTAPRSVSGLVEFALSELDIADPDLARAAGRTLSGHASLNWAEGAPLKLWGMRVVSGDVTLAARGEMEALADGLPVTGTARLDAPDLARFAPLTGQDLAGAVGATITGSGSLLGGDFDIELDAQTDRLALGIAQVDPLIGPPGTLRLKARRDTEGTALEELRIVNDALEAEAEGRLDGQSGTLTIAAALAELGLIDRRLDGEARLSGDVGWQAGGAVTLDGVEATAMGAEITATGTLSPEAEGMPVSGRMTLAAEDLARFAEIAGTALRGRLDATLSGEGRGTGESLSITLDAEGRELATGIADLDRLIAGQLDLSARAGRSPERINIDEIRLSTPQLRLTADGDGAGGPVRISSRLANLGLILSDFPGAVTADGTVTLRGPDARRISVALDATGPGGTQARVNGDVDEYGQRLNITTAGRLPLALVNSFIQPNALAGTAQFDLRVNGAPGLGAVSGTVQTEGTRVALPGANLAIDDLTGTATLGQSRVRTDFAARLREGGTLRITGPIDLRPGYAGDLTLDLDRITLTDRLIYTTTADGRVTVNGPLTGGARIGGRIDIGETEIRIPSGLGPASATLSGLRHVGEPAAVRRTRARAGLIEKAQGGGGGTARPYPLDLTINAPDRIFVRGRGLDAELGGRLRVGGTTASVEPAGFFELVRGRLDILGKRLTLTEGRVTMQGALDPYLRFVAETDIDDTEVQVIIEGLASSPEVSFTSNPDLPEEEIVSRLIFGRGLDNISPIQAAQLASAVSTLSGGGNGIVDRLRGGLGLSNLDVTQTAEGDTAVSAGAYVTDNVYTEVTADSSGRQEINLNLDITRSLTAKGSTSSEGDAGIGIFFERDY